MEQYLVELYRPRKERDSLADSAELARAAAEQLTREGTPVQYVRAIFLFEDEICFHVYEAASAEAAAEAAKRAGLAFERVVTAITEAPL